MWNTTHGETILWGQIVLAFAISVHRLRLRGLVYTECGLSLPFVAGSNCQWYWPQSMADVKLWEVSGGSITKPSNNVMQDCLTDSPLRGFVNRVQKMREIIVPAPWLQTASCVIFWTFTSRYPVLSGQSDPWAYIESGLRRMAWQETNEHRLGNIF